MNNINNFSYEDISIGHKEVFTTEITQEKQHMFLKISGDTNPLHIDENYAQTKGFSGNVVYGMLTASFYSTLVGTLLPGRKCLFQEADIKFRKPVFIGDTLEISGECVDKNDLFKRLTIKAKIKNQHNELVSSAKLKVGMQDE